MHVLLLDKSQTTHFPNGSCSKCQMEIQIQATLSKFFFCKYPLFSSSLLHKILLIRKFTLETAWRRVLGRPLPSCLPAVQEGSAVDGGDQAGGAGGAGVTLRNWIVAVQSFSCVWLFCGIVDCSSPDFPVHHHLLEFAQTHVHWVGDAIQPSHPLLSPSPPAFNLSQHQGLIHQSWLFTSDGQSIGASASVSNHPMNIQDWSPLGWTGLIS